MKAVPSTDLWRPSARRGALLPDTHRLAAAIFMRDTGLRDLPEVLPSRAGRGTACSPSRSPCGREIKAFLSPADMEGEAGHLLLGIERELDPFAVAATENERLLGEVVRLKDLHQKIFDNIGYGIAVVDASRRIVFCNTTHRILLTGGPAAAGGAGLPLVGLRHGGLRHLRLRGGDGAGRPGQPGGRAPGGGEDALVPPRHVPAAGRRRQGHGRHRGHAGRHRVQGSAVLPRERAAQDGGRHPGDRRDALHRRRRLRAAVLPPRVVPGDPGVRRGRAQPQVLRGAVPANPPLSLVPHARDAALGQGGAAGRPLPRRATARTAPTRSPSRPAASVRANCPRWSACWSTSRPRGVSSSRWSSRRNSTPCPSSPRAWPTS